MPLTRITLCEGMSDAHLQQLSALYHQTLVEVFEVPPKDKFQILEILPASALIYDPTTRPTAGTRVSSSSRSWRARCAAPRPGSGFMHVSPSALRPSLGSTLTTSWW